jgi:HlyD family secretion protein
MVRKFFFPAAALLGAIVALLVVFWSQRKVPVAPIPFPPPVSPYEHSIAGEGIVEAASRNISIGSPFSQIITKIYVVEGDVVKAGDPIFLLDTRVFDAQKEAARSQIEAARISLENTKDQFSFYERLRDRRAVSEQQYDQTYYAMREAEEQLNVAVANLAVVEANIDQSLIRAPIAGKILQVNVHVGEVAPNTPPQSSQLLIPYASANYPLILMGTVDPPNLRIDIDEEDAWRYSDGAPATAFVRGNSRIKYSLEFVRLEPYIVPKASFTGATTERIDTRVLQALYRFPKGDLIGVYPGQVLDVYLESATAQTSLRAKASK